MESVVWVVCLIICVLYTTFKQVTGCSFVDTHPQDKFCSRDFVLLGKVLTEEPFTENASSTPSEPVRTYQLQIIYRMKGRLPRPGSTFKITTPWSSSACGIELGKGQRYILSGFIEQEGNMVTQLDFHMRFVDLSPEQSLYLYSAGQYSYRRNCRCTERFGVACDDGDFSCGICMYRDGHCEWQNENCS